MWLNVAQVCFWKALVAPQLMICALFGPILVIKRNETDWYWAITSVFHNADRDQLGAAANTEDHDSVPIYQQINPL
jgi:hypothetical protein